MSIQSLQLELLTQQMTEALGDRLIEVCVGGSGPYMLCSGSMRGDDRFVSWIGLHGFFYYPVVYDDAGGIWMLAEWKGMDPKESFGYEY